MRSTEADSPLASAERKAAWRLLPFLLLLYVLAFLDRVNIGYAKQAFLHDTGLSEAAYAFGASIFFIAYALFEIPSNLILHRVGARIWICRIMVSWGIISAATMAAHTAVRFYALRFLLGGAEAGFFPGMILYLTYWFPSRRRAAILGLFYFGAPLSQIFGGPLSGWLLDLHGRGGLAGWQWMFLIEGALAVPAGVWTYFYLTDRPRQARWLSEEERNALVAATEGEQHAIERIGGRHTLAALRQPRVVHFAIVYILMQTATYGVSFYLPSQIAGLFGRQTGLWVGVVSAIPWACALIAVSLLPRLAAATNRESVVAGLAMAVAAVGIVLSAGHGPIVGLVALSIATAGFIGAQPVFWILPSSELADAGAAGGIALINSVGAMGSFFAPNFRAWAERTWASPTAGVLALGLATAVGAVLVFSLGGRVRTDPGA